MEHWTPRSWMIEQQLLACSYPMDDADWQALQALGIVTVINLHEQPHGEHLAARRGIRELHLPTEDFTPPQPAAIDAGVAAIAAEIAAGTPIAVHCRAGLGRTGTLLACYFASTGLPADDAIALVRHRRPGSVETAEQEAAVHAYAARTKGSLAE